MQKTTETHHSPETCEHLYWEIVGLFWNLNGTNRTVDKTNEFLFNLIELYPDASSECKKNIEENFKKISTLEVWHCKPSIRLASKLDVMLPAYHTVTRCAKYTPLYNILQNLIVETATSLQDWYDVANNEVPLPGLNKEVIVETIPGTLKNIALQMILLKGKTLEDMAYVKRNCTHKSQLYVNANNASISMLSSSN